MNHCIKCGQEIPDHELFCIECSLTPTSVLSAESHSAERPQAPKGRMMTPQPVKTPAAPAVAVVERVVQPPKAKPSRGPVTALIIVSLLLALVTGFLVWQLGSIQIQKNRLRTKEADLSLRESELAELQAQVEELNLQIANLDVQIELRDQSIQDLKTQLSGSQSTQSQNEYDLNAKQNELDLLSTENQQLLAQVEELEAQVTALTDTQADLQAALEAAAPYKVKAEFMDSFVVFVENDNSGYYHTYDCTAFPKNKFWAYSRNLAESTGFSACPTCGGTP